MKKLVALSILNACVIFAQAPASKQVEVFGQKIHYLEAGSGPDVILLHGLGGDAANWAMNTAVLAKSFHVYVPDQIGFGESDKPLINYRVGTLVDFLNGFYKKLGIARASLVGNSLGGWTAMAFTLAHPEKVNRLVLVDSAGYSFEKLGVPKPAKALLDGLNPSTIEGSKALIALIFANKAMATDAVAEQLFAAHMKKNDGYTIERFIESILRGEDVVDGKLGAIQAPSQIIWGREDGLVPLVAGQMMTKEIARSEMVILDHCGHVPQLECAAPFNEALVKFLSAGAGQPAASGR